MKGKSAALVTGAGLGIGRGITLELAKAGYDIAGVDIEYDSQNSHSGLGEVKQRVEEFGTNFLPIQGDISSLEDHKKILELTYSKFKRIDVLVNNAGVAPENRLDILDTTPESYDRILSVNSRGAFFLTQRAARKMIDLVQKDTDFRPCIVFISSISAALPMKRACLLTGLAKSYGLYSLDRSMVHTPSSPNSTVNACFA